MHDKLIGVIEGTVAVVQVAATESVCNVEVLQLVVGVTVKKQCIILSQKKECSLNFICLYDPLLDSFNRN
jgi:hypothetical protein